eukprot:353460-Chlamydomonas_euryale.AAC.2
MGRISEAGLEGARCSHAGRRRLTAAAAAAAPPQERPPPKPQQLRQHPQQLWQQTAGTAFARSCMLYAPTSKPAHHCCCGGSGSQAPDCRTCLAGTAAMSPAQQQLRLLQDHKSGRCVPILWEPHWRGDRPVVGGCGQCWRQTGNDGH